MKNSTPNDIAVIGMSGRFPGARDIQQFWENLCNGVESVTLFSEEEIGHYLNGMDYAGADLARKQSEEENYVRSGFVLDDIDMFDASFFGYNPSDAELIDPQHRIFLETAWHAFEDAGYNPEQCDYPVGVFAGTSMSQYYMVNIFSNRNIYYSERDLTALIGNEVDYLPTRVSYKLNLRGPSMSVQSACSSSMVAIHLACRSLINNECSMALAGGSFVQVPQTKGYMYREGGLLSKDGHVRVFDAKASGTVFSNGGVAGVVLKRLEDATRDGDHIYSVIKGTAVDNDGSDKTAMTAPTVKGQMQVIRQALSQANVTPEQITYVEAHGTGTLVGDPIEVSSLNNIYSENNSQKNYCGIGSLKSNVGHLDRVAGVTGLIKASLCLENKMIPPALNFEQPNPRIDFENSPFYVNTLLKEWNTDIKPRRAGVNSFGVGGTNAHAVLEEAPASNHSDKGRIWQLLSFSARTADALEVQTNNLIEYLENHPNANLADVAYTLHVGRKGFTHRRSVAVNSVQYAIEALKQNNLNQVYQGKTGKKTSDLVFMFSGQGSQYVNMGLALYRNEPVFRQSVDSSAEIFQQLTGFDIREFIYPPIGNEQQASKKLQQTSITQPALFIIEYALVQLLDSWGIRPKAMIGHSIGEYVAACVAGVFSVSTAIRLVTRRGELMQEMQTGDMLAVNLPESEVREMVGKELCIAAINSPSSCVVSGTHQDLDGLEQSLSTIISCQRLHTSHAFHSWMMDPMLDEFRMEVASHKLNPPLIPFQSNLSGTWITNEQVTDPGYWASHLRNTVRFAEGVQSLVSEDDAIFLEVGPGHALTGLARQSLSDKASEVIPIMHHPKKPQDAHEYIIGAIGQLWNYGISPDWTAFYPERRKRLSLPKYPFEKMRYWVEAKQDGENKSMFRNRGQDGWFYLPQWKQSFPVAISEDQDNEPFSVLYFSCQQASDDFIQQVIEQKRIRVIRVQRGEGFVNQGDLFQIDPQDASHYEQLVEMLLKRGEFPSQILHGWNLFPTDGIQVGGTVLDLEERYQQVQLHGFYSLMFLAQALGKNGVDQSVTLTTLSCGIYNVLGNEDIHPERASILGACKVIPLEYPNIKCRSIDIGDETLTQAQANQVLREMLVDSDDPVIALRNYHRWVQDFENVELGSIGATPPVLRKGGVYVITGGLGGIGLAMADYIADQVEPTLVLISRSSLPDESEWESIVASGDTDSLVTGRIQSLLALKNKGATVKVYAADVTNYRQMKKIIDEVHQQYGNIHGVIHSAGVAGGGLIQLKTHDMSEKVLQPKIVGSLILEELLREDRLDLFVLCSSLFSIVGGIGQIDYCAANSFLDAFAQKRNGHNGEMCISINWDAWQDIGMAVKAAEQLHSSQRGSVSGRDTDHPLLGHCIKQDGSEVIYAQNLNIEEHWILAEHRVMGSSIMPGTGYLEIARAAMVDATGADSVEFDNVLFMTPLEVPEKEYKLCRVKLKRNDGDWDVSIESRLATEDDSVGWVSHFTCRASQLTEYRKEVVDTSLLEQQMDGTVYDLKGKFPAINTDWNENRLIEFGPRWFNINKVTIKGSTAFLALEIDESFASDMDSFRMHPSLLDMATAPTIAPMLVQGMEWSGELYLPFSYDRLVWHYPLTRNVFSVVRNVPGEKDTNETIVQDISIYDTEGKLLVEVQGFTLRRVHEGALKSQKREHTVNHANRADGADSDLMILGGQGIPPKQGIEAFSRILRYRYLPQIVVSTSDLKVLLDDISAISRSAVEHLAQPEEVKELHPRPNISTEYVEPKTEIEQVLATIWQNVLGVDRVGLHDNFFELGADSVLGIQVISRAKDADIMLNPNQLFEHQTIAELATVAVPMGGAITEMESRSFAVTSVQQQYIDDMQGVQSYLVNFAEIIDSEMLQSVIDMVGKHLQAASFRFDLSHDPAMITVEDAGSVTSFTELSGAIDLVEEQDILTRIAEEVASANGALIHYVLRLVPNSHASLYIVVNNLMADHKSMAIIINNITQTYEMLKQKVEPEWPEQTVSLLESFQALDKVTEQEIDAIIDQHSLSCMLNAASLQSLYTGAMNGRMSEPETWSLTVAPALFDALESDANQSYNTRTEELMLVALSRTLHRKTGSFNHVFNIGLDARACFSEEETLPGQYEVIWPSMISLENDGLDLQIRSIKDQIRTLGTQANRLVAYKYSDSARNESITDLGKRAIGFVFQDSIAIQGSLVDSVTNIELGRITEHPVFRYSPVSVYVSINASGMTLHWKYHPKQFDIKKVRVLAQNFMNELDEVVRHCHELNEVKYSTMDFPEAALMQSELDSLLEDISDLEV